MTSTLRTAARSLRRAIPVGAVATAAALPLLLPTPAQATTSETQLYVWATGVGTYGRARRACPPIAGAQIGKRWVTAYCQSQGSQVVDGPYRNNWWVQVNAGGPIGWISAVYVSTGENDQPVPGVPDGADCR